MYRSNSRNHVLRAGLALLVLFTLTPANVAAQQCWELVWSDEFPGPSIDLTKWEFEVNGQGGGNNELQYYTDRPENAQIVGGVLHIIGRQETYTGPDGTRDYTSARLRTRNQGDWRYGRIEASLKLPYGQGMWPAFWMLPTDSVYGGWPQSGEIDIMENVGFAPDVVYGTIHYGDPWPNNSNSGASTSVSNSSTQFHTYAIEWEENVIRWYVDGNLFSTKTPADIAPKFWPFDQRFHILLNLAIGGNWPGSPDGTTVFPQHYEIDWVRVYQGIASYSLTGDDSVFEGDTGKVYTIDQVAGASYNWSVPAGATITSGQGTNSITVNWGTTGGPVTVTLTTSCASRDYTVDVTVSPPLAITHVFDNFNNERNVTYNLAITAGTLTENVSNPAPDAVNGSNSVGRYVRNAAEQYDALFMTSADLGNANDYRFGRKVIFMDLYTDAPVGTKATVQLENAALSNNNPYPTGRHSAYDAFTTVQNGWQRLEFPWSATTDTGTGIFDVDQVVVLFDSGNLTGNTYYFDNFEVGSQPIPPVISTEVVENYDGTSNWTYASSSGTYNGSVSNPGPNAVNNSATAARYVRNSAEQYDTLVYNGFSMIGDASLFVNGDSKILVDVYTSAPVGTDLSFNLENSTIAANPYPAGRHSVYQAKTTVQNQWETVTFEYAYSPDAGTPDTGIDQLIFLFDSGGYTGDTYYIDNVRIVNTKEPPTYEDNTIYENYDGTSVLTVGYYDGVYNAPVSNPSPGGVNTSANVGSYTRDAATQWDVLFFDTTAIAATAFEAGDQVFALDLYTSAPVGTPITWQLEDSSLTSPTNFPTGRRSSFVGAVGKQNEWHTVRFKFNQVLDGSTSPTAIDNMVLLFDGGGYTGDTYTIDNLRSQDVIEGSGGTPVLTTIVVSPSSANVGVGATQQFTAQGYDQNGSPIASSPSWSVSGGGTINSSGLFTASATGTFTVTADDGGISDTASVTVVAVPVLTTITVSPDPGSVQEGQTLQFSAACLDQFGAAIACNPSWSTSGGGTINAAGLYAATTAGSYTVTAADGGVNDSAAVNVTSAPVLTLLSQGKPAFSSSNENAGFLPANAVDGNTGTRWSSGFTDNEWIYVDLQATYTVSRVVLNWEAAYGEQYQIQVSDNATSWTTVSTEGNSDGGIDDVTFAGTSARYVRMLGIIRALPYGYSLWELEIYGSGGTAPTLGSIVVSPDPGQATIGGTFQFSAQAYDTEGQPMSISFDWSTSGGGTINASGLFTATGPAGVYTVQAKDPSGPIYGTAGMIVDPAPTTNVALGKPAVSSSNENGSFTADKAFDGSTGTRWSSQFSDPQWLYVDLQAVYNLTSVKLVWETAASASYQIQVSNDASNWTTIYADTNGNGGTDDFTVSGSGRYVRMYSSARTTQWGNSLWEMEVYGTP